jgi:hypothetical protein
MLSSSSSLCSCSSSPSLCSFSSSPSNPPACAPPPFLHSYSACRNARRLAISSKVPSSKLPGSAVRQVMPADGRLSSNERHWFHLVGPFVFFFPFSFAVTGPRSPRQGYCGAIQRRSPRPRAQHNRGWRRKWRTFQFWQRCLRTSPFRRSQ